MADNEKKTGEPIDNDDLKNVSGGVWNFTTPEYGGVKKYEPGIQIEADPSQTYNQGDKTVIVEPSDNEGFLNKVIEDMANRDKRKQ